MRYLDPLGPAAGSDELLVTPPSSTAGPPGRSLLPPNRLEAASGERRRRPHWGKADVPLQIYGRKHKEDPPIGDASTNHGFLGSMLIRTSTCQVHGKSRSACRQPRLFTPPMADLGSDPIVVPALQITYKMTPPLVWFATWQAF